MIVLVNPPNPPGMVSNKDTMGGLGQLYPLGTLSKMPPLDLLHCAAVLRRRQVPFQMLECLGSALDRDLFLDAIGKLPVQLIAIRTSLPSFDWDLEIAGLAKRATGASVLLFGHCMTYLQEEALRHDAVDAVLLGEPELALAEVASRGLAARHPNLLKKGETNDTTPHPALVGDLDELPFPAWDLAPYTVYSGTELMRNITPFATMLTSRGCVHGCMYCPYPVTQGGRLRHHSVQRVVEEMKWLQDELGVRAVLFRDPEFAVNRDRVAALCEQMMAQGVRIAWRCETRIENLDAQIIKLMARAGCIGLNMGIESLDEGVLSMLGRKVVATAHAEIVVSEARKAGIETFCFFILGLPGETIRTSLTTISAAVALGCDHLQFTAATPYPGTRLYYWAEERGYLENRSRALFTGYDPVMHNGHLSVSDIGALRIFAGSVWALRLMRREKRRFDPFGLWHRGKQSFRVTMQEHSLLRRSRALGE